MWSVGFALKNALFLNLITAENPIKEAICKAGYRTDESKRIESALGGIAVVITERFIKSGKIVVGCG